MTLHYCDGCESIKQDSFVMLNTCEHCGHRTVVVPIEDGVEVSAFNDRMMAAWQEYQSKPL